MTFSNAYFQMELIGIIDSINLLALSIGAFSAHGHIQSIFRAFSGHVQVNFRVILIRAIRGGRSCYCKIAKNGNAFARRRSCSWKAKLKRSKGKAWGEIGNSAARCGEEKPRGSVVTLRGVTDDCVLDYWTPYKAGPGPAAPAAPVGSMAAPARSLWVTSTGHRSTGVKPHTSFIFTWPYPLHLFAILQPFFSHFRMLFIFRGWLAVFQSLVTDALIWSFLTYFSETEAHKYSSRCHRRRCPIARPIAGSIVHVSLQPTGSRFCRSP